MEDYPVFENLCDWSWCYYYDGRCPHCETHGNPEVK